MFPYYKFNHQRLLKREYSDGEAVLATALPLRKVIQNRPRGQVEKLISFPLCPQHTPVSISAMWKCVAGCVCVCINSKWSRFQ